MDGFVLINKPVGMASFAVTSAVKRKSGTRRCGHAGTLDPIASGVLPVMIGRATRLIDLIDDNKKIYIATGVLGLTTDTLDCEGEVLSDQPVSVTEEMLLDTLGEFVGEITQIPPMYSALKKDGKKLYELARQGVNVDRAPRKATIFSIKLLEFSGDTFKIEVACKKGTYIRTLIDDVGTRLKCGAYMAQLVRTFSNGFSLESCVNFDLFCDGSIDDFLCSPDDAIKSYPCVSITSAQAVRFSNGGELDLKRVKILSDSEIYRVYCDEKFLGLGFPADGCLKPKCVF